MKNKRKTQSAKREIRKIGVLMGGPSAEREISLKSGKAVLEALEDLGFNAVGIKIETDNVKENIRLLKSHKIDCAFLALHGRFGEDGQIQAILDELKIAYTGSGRLASQLAMDKVSTRRILEVYGLAVPRYRVAEKKSYHPSYLNDLGMDFPLVVKPVSGGSSIGLSIVDAKKDLPKAMDLAFQSGDKVIIEEYIRGREITVGVLEGQALPAVEIVPKKRFFDYEAKYCQGMTEYIVPAPLEEETARKVKEAARKVHNLLGCYAYSRVDMILNEENVPFVLEVNTIPGFTKTSLFPKAAKVVGMDFGQLCVKLIKLANEKK